MSPAARAPDMSPAVVTPLVADQESHVSARLLHRTTRRLSLSDAGETYLARVHAILQGIDEGHAIAGAHTQDLSGMLHVMTQPVLATHVLAPHLAEFARRYPKIVLDLHVESFKEPPIEDYDITLFPADSSYDSDVIARKIMSTQIILVASPLYLQRSGTPLNPQDLAGHDCLRQPLRGMRPRRLHLINAQSPGQNIDQEVVTVLWANHIDTLLRAACDGMGITATSVELVAEQLASGALVRVVRPWIAGEITLFATLPSRKFLPRHTQVFLDYLTEQVRQQVATDLAACSDC